MNDLQKIRTAYDEAMDAIESGYFHRVRNAFKKLIATFEQECPERTQDPAEAFLQLQVAAASIHYHVFLQDGLSATNAFVQLNEDCSKLLASNLLDECHRQKTQQLLADAQKALENFQKDLERVDYSVMGQPSPYDKTYDLHDQFRNHRRSNGACLLCKASEHLCTGSHLAPHFIVGSIFSFDGSRDRDKEIVNEETLASLVTEKKWGSRVEPDAIDQIYGEEIPENEKAERKQNALTRDCLFCKGCEDRFGHIENAYSALFANRNKKLNPAVSYLFWLSVFWRLSVSNMCVRLCAADEEAIRQILNSHMPDTRKCVDGLAADERYGTYRYCLYHCSNIKGELTGLVGNHVSRSPYKLILGNYVVVLYSSKTKRDKKKTYNDWHTNEVCQEISFLDFWKMKRNILDTVEDLEFSNLTADESSIIDVMQADSGMAVKHLIPRDTRHFSLDDIGDGEKKYYSSVMPGSVARMLAWTKSHRHLSIADQCCGIERDLGYTAQEMEYMYNWYFSRLNNIKSVRKRKK